MNLTSVFAKITKTERSDDGNLLVYGKVAGPELDLDRQICDPTWLKSAMPEWFESGANIRQMHQPIAIGKGVELEQDGDDWWLTAKVVDKAAQLLVEEGVLSGFSIGIKAPRIVKDAGAPNGRIVGGKIIENSLVDRGSNETCKLVLAKMAGGHMVHVEELVTKDAGDALDIAGSVDTADGSTGDAAGDEAAEVDLIAVARTALTKWLASEAAEVEAGKGGTGVVRIICSLLDDLSFAEFMDEWDDTDAAVLEATKAALIGDQEETIMKLAQVADLVKAATADGATVEDKTAADELRKALGIDTITEQIADVSTKAATAEDLTKVAARLAKVEEMAAPGGPARLAPVPPAKDPTVLNKAAEYRRMADAVQDPDLAAAYRRRALELDPSAA